jgi:mono/diheme cytochrome c family protein
LSKDRVFPVLVVLHGLAGAIEVDGAEYNASMPAFDHLSDSEIAAVVNFVRAFSGKPSASGPITPEGVGTQRKRKMTPAEVHAYRANMK